MAPIKKGADAPRKLFQVAMTGTLYVDGSRIHLSPHSPTVYDEDHPLVRRFPGFFKEIAPVGRQAPVKVEQATAEPGEARNATVPEQ